MAAPTETEIQAQISAVVEILDETRKFGHVNAKNWNDLENAIVTQQEGNFAAEVLAALATSRASLNSALNSDAAARLLTPLILEYAKYLDIATTDLTVVFAEMRRHFAAFSKSIQERNFTFGSPSAGSNVGDGALHRLTVDRYGNDLEAVHEEAKEARCTGDEFSGASRHEEGFAIFGGALERDQIKIAGSGLVEGINSVSARTSENFLRNPSFEQSTLGTDGDLTTPTDIDGWVVAGGGSPFTNVDLSTTVYRGYSGIDDADLVSVKLTGNEKLSQPLEELNPIIDPTVPMFLQVAFRPENSADGTLTVRLGSQSSNIVVSGTGWKLLFLELGTKNWYDNFNETGLDVEIEWSARTTGELLLDDVLLVPFNLFDGTWYVLTGGATPFRRDDEFTWADTEVGAKIQTWFWRAFGEYLISSATPTWSDPT